MNALRIAAFFVLSMVLGSVPSVMAQVPTTINFQGKLTNLAGVPSNGNFSVVFSVWDSASGGSQLWTETQPVSISNGIYNVTLGTGTALSTDIFTSSGTWLQIKVGSDQPMTPRIKFNAVPYALKTQLATALLSGLPVNDLFSSIKPVRQYVNTSGYTVPAGKNLVIISANGGCAIDNEYTYWNGVENVTQHWSERINCTMPVSGNHTAISALGYKQKNPAILGPGDVITSTSTTNPVKMKGFLIPASVSVILQNMGIGGTYTVPAGKTFYFGLLKTADNCSGDTNIDGFADTIGGGGSGVMEAGQILTNNTNCTLVLNGYLR